MCSTVRRLWPNRLVLESRRSARIIRSPSVRLRVRTHAATVRSALPELKCRALTRVTPQERDRKQTRASATSPTNRGGCASGMMAAGGRRRSVLRGIAEQRPTARVPSRFPTGPGRRPWLKPRSPPCRGDYC